MLRRAPQCLLLAALATLAPVSAHAASFDVIFADSIDVVSPPDISGFNTGDDIALIVNTGPTNIAAADLFGAIFTAASSDPVVAAFPFVNDPGPAVAPILPNEAVGTLLAGSPLIDRLMPGETLRNTWPLQVFGLIVHYPAGYTGTVALTITMTMGTDVAQYYTLLNIKPGSEFSVSTAHAGRVSCQSFPTSARTSTWGAVKGRYR